MMKLTDCDLHDPQIQGSINWRIDSSSTSVPVNQQNSIFQSSEMKQFIDCHVNMQHVVVDI